MKVYSFEKLLGWQNAKELTIWIYRLTEVFPAEEKYGLLSQMRRAAVSIASNIAEGSSRISMKVQAHFSNIACSSTVVLLKQLIIAFELQFISNLQYEEGRQMIENQTFFNFKTKSITIR